MNGSTFTEIPRPSDNETKKIKQKEEKIKQKEEKIKKEKEKRQVKLKKKVSKLETKKEKIEVELMKERESTFKIDLKGIQLTNWTSRDVNIYDLVEDKAILVIKKSSTVVDLKQENQSFTMMKINGTIIPVISKPNPLGLTNIDENDVIDNVIVSVPVAEYLYLRHIDPTLKTSYRNVFAPNFGSDSSILNEEGEIIGINQLICYISDKVMDMTLTMGPSQY